MGILEADIKKGTKSLLNKIIAEKFQSFGRNINIKIYTKLKPFYVDTMWRGPLWGTL